MSAINSGGGGATNSTGSTLVVPGDTAADAFGRARVSQALSVFDNKQLYEKESVVFDEAAALGATSTFLPNEAAVELAVTTTTGSKLTRQTRQYFPYHPGQSQLMVVTGVLGAPVPGVTQQIGLFDDNNGVFFEQEGNTLRVVRRSSVSGSPVDEKQDQDNWNLDRLNGSGPSGVDIDPASSNIFLLDLAWLGVGTIRMGIQISGRVVWAHEFANENILPGVYMSTPVLPVRYQIETTGSPAGPASMKHICTSIYSEGVLDPLGLILSENLGVTPRTLMAGVATPMIAVRALDARKRITVEPVDFNVASIDKVDYLVEIYIGGSLNGAWAAADGSSNVEVNKTATTLTGGRRIESIYGSSTNQSAPATFGVLKSALKAAAGITGSADPITVVVTQVTGPDSDYLASLTWKELF